MSSLLAGAYYSLFRFATVDEIVRWPDLFVWSCGQSYGYVEANKPVWSPYSHRDFKRDYPLSKVYSGPVDVDFASRVPTALLGCLNKREELEQATAGQLTSKDHSSLLYNDIELAVIVSLTALCQQVKQQSDSKSESGSKSQGLHQATMDFISQLANYHVITEFARDNCLVHNVDDIKLQFHILTSWRQSTKRIHALKLALTLEDIKCFDYDYQNIFNMGDDYLTQFRLKATEQLGSPSAASFELLFSQRDKLQVGDHNRACLEWLWTTYGDDCSAKQRMHWLYFMGYAVKSSQPADSLPIIPMSTFLIRLFQISRDDLIKLYFYSFCWRQAITEQQLLTGQQLAAINHNDVAKYDALKIPQLTSSVDIMIVDTGDEVVAASLLVPANNEQQLQQWLSQLQQRQQRQQ